MRISPWVLIALAGGTAVAGPAFGPPPKPGPAVRKPGNLTMLGDHLGEMAEAVIADKAGKLEDAYSRYRRVADDAKQPAIYYNMADVLRRMERTKDAIEAYKKYLDAATDATDRADVEKLIATLQGTPPILTIDGEDLRAVVYLDGVLVGPSPQTIQVVPGKHTVARIGPTSFEEDHVEAKPLDVRHLQSSGRDAPGNVVLTFSANVGRSLSWRDRDQSDFTWRIPGRIAVAPGKVSTRIGSNDEFCTPLSFDVPKGDGVLYVHVEASERPDRGCTRFTVKTTKVGFPP